MKEQESISRIAVIICLNVQFSTPNHEKYKETGNCDPYTEKKKKQARKTSCDWGGGGGERCGGGDVGQRAQIFIVR